MKRLKEINYVTIFISIVTFLSITLSVLENYNYLSSIDRANSDMLNSIRDYNTSILLSTLEDDTEYENLDVYKFVTGKEAYETGYELISEKLKESYHFSGLGSIDATVKVEVGAGITKTVAIVLIPKITVIKYENGDVFEEVVIYEPGQEYGQTKSFKIFYDNDKQKIYSKIIGKASMSNGEPVADYRGVDWDIYDFDKWLNETNCDVREPLYLLSGNVDGYIMQNKTQDPITKETMYEVKVGLDGKATDVYAELLQEVTRGVTSKIYSGLANFTKSELTIQIGGSGNINPKIKAYDVYDFKAKVLQGKFNAHVYFDSTVYYTMVQAGGVIDVERPVIE